MRKNQRLFGFLFVGSIVAALYWLFDQPTENSARLSSGQSAPVNTTAGPAPSPAALVREASPSRVGVTSLRQAVYQQVDAMIAASQSTENALRDPEQWYAQLSPVQKAEFRHRCLAESGLKDLAGEHLNYHQQFGLKTWAREKEILQAMQAKCERIRPFVQALIDETATDGIDPDTGLGEFYLDLIAQNEENGPGVATALAMQHLMDPDTQRREDARRFLVENGVVFDFLVNFMPDQESNGLAEFDRSQIRPEQARQMLDPLFAVVDCEAGFMDCGPGSFWALQQCRDYPRSCGMSPYEALHFNTLPEIMALYDRILQVLRSQYQQLSNP